MTLTMTPVGTIPQMGHSEAMALGETEAGRLLDVVDQLRDEDWERPTDCAGWDVKALLSHVLGGMEGNARTREFVRQYLAANSAAKHSGGAMIDEMTALQVADWGRFHSEGGGTSVARAGAKGDPRPAAHTQVGACRALQARSAGGWQLEGRLSGRDDHEP